MEKLYKNYEWLKEQYIDKKLSTRFLAKISNCSRPTISNWIVKFNIQKRTFSESIKIAMKQPEVRKNLFARPKLSGKSAPNWQGGRVKRNGYIFIKTPSHPFKNNHGYVREHRLICEASLRKYFPGHHGLIEINGEKYLRKDWIAHHNDEVTDNNIWSNLTTMPDPFHRRFHRLGKKYSEETKRKLSNIKKQQWQDDIYDRNRPRDPLGRFTKGDHK